MGRCGSLWVVPGFSNYATVTLGICVSWQAHIIRNIMCSFIGEHILVVICVIPLPAKHISLVICVSQVGEHVN